MVIDSLLTSYEGVIAAETGHVSTHEAGAIEFTGHKVLTLPSHQGKIQAAELAAYVDNFYHDGNHDHMVFQGWFTFLTQLNMARSTPKKN